MHAASIAETLAQLDRAPGSAAVRFDSPDGLRGPVAFLPAAFNPPTVAHLRLLQRAAAAVAAAPAALLTTRNVDKPVTGAPLEARVEMLVAARRDGHDIAVLAANVARIIEQAAAIEATFPAVDATPVVGFDTLVRLFDPRYYADLSRELDPFFERHRVIAANRNPHALEAVAEWLHHNARGYASRVVLVELDSETAGVSSTRARELVAAGIPADLVPPSVRAILAERRFYTPGTPVT
jgi:nicotinamide-nucleotide adenylyltransferase